MHSETVMVYFEDLDAMGVVHNGRYAALLERALAGYWARAGWPYDPSQPRFAMTDYSWIHDIGAVNLTELSELYRIAPLGDKPPAVLATVFGNSMFTCFAYDGEVLAGAGRVLADGLDCAYIADVAVHPDHQGRGLGTQIIR